MSMNNIENKSIKSKLLEIARILRQFGLDLYVSMLFVNSNRLQISDEDGRAINETVLAKLGYALGTNGPIDLREYLETSTTQSDIVVETKGFLIGIVYYFQIDDDMLVYKNAEFNVKITKPLSPFKYKKPIVGDDVFKPDERWESTERINYYPLLIVKDAYRGPNHWHRRDDALFCAVNIDGIWQTRYFSKNNVSAKIWKEAEDLL